MKKDTKPFEKLDVPCGVNNMEIKNDNFLPSVILPCQPGDEVYHVFPVTDAYGYRTGKYEVVPTTVKRVDIYVEKDLVKYDIVSSDDPWLTLGWYNNQTKKWDSCEGENSIHSLYINKFNAEKKVHELNKEK